MSDRGEFSRLYAGNGSSAAINRSGLSQPAHGSDGDKGNAAPG